MIDIKAEATRITTLDWRRDAIIDLVTRVRDEQRERDAKICTERAEKHNKAWMKLRAPVSTTAVKREEAKECAAAIRGSK